MTEKAFDRVPHKRLVIKLDWQGIRGNVLRWVENILANCFHRVAIQYNFGWLPVHSGVPQGSVVGPVLFIIYINDLVANLESQASLFADDAKIYRIISTAQDTEILRSDMVGLKEWSSKWLLTFNSAKCKVVHFGRQNTRSDYTLNGVTLDISAVGKDLGVLISEDLKVASHVAATAGKANSRVSIIRRNFTYLNWKIVWALYTAIVRPLLDYGAQCWTPFLAKDIEQLGEGQHRTTKLVPEFAHFPYKDRCRVMGLQMLKDRRRRGDMIQVYKIFHGYDHLPATRFFQLSTTSLRGHSLKITKHSHWRTALKGNALSIQTINDWNALPDQVVTAPSIAAFKSRYDKHLGIAI